MDLGALAMKGYSTFPKAPALLELTIKFFNVTYRALIGESAFFSHRDYFYSIGIPDVVFLRTNNDPKMRYKFTVNVTVQTGGIKYL